MAGGVDVRVVAEPGGDPGLVQRNLERYGVGQLLVHGFGVLREPLTRLPTRPTIVSVLQDPRQIPICLNKTGEAMGFMNTTLRHEGTSTPVESSSAVVATTGVSRSGSAKRSSQEAASPF